MNTSRCWSRRTFLGATLAAGAATTLPWSRSTSWAAEGPVSPLRLAFYTDIHARVEWETPEAMAICADQINAQKADLVICGGDLVTDGFTSTTAQMKPRWAAYKAGFPDRLTAPLFTAIGNHDLIGVEPVDGSPPESDFRAAFREANGLASTYRSVDAGGCHIVFLDPIEPTGDALRYRGNINTEQMKWLREDLARVDTQTPIILVVHMPLMTGFFQATQGATAPATPNRVVINSLDVLGAFADHNLVLVLQGHLHVNELLRWRKTTFITGGSVCGQWWRGPWQATPEGFGVITLRPDRVDWDYHSYGWKARRPPAV